MYYLTSFSLLVFHCYIIIFILDHQWFLSFFWRYVSFFRNFYIKSIIFGFSFNCLWTILWLSSWDFCNFFRHFITNQITNCFYYYLTCSCRSSFKCISSRLFSMIKKFWLYSLLMLLRFTVFTDIVTHIFCRRQNS